MTVSENQEYVKISTTTEGDALVEVLSPTQEQAVMAYKYIIDRLKEEGFTVANDKANEIKVTNENSKFSPQVTAKGRGQTVVIDYLNELKNAHALVVTEDQFNEIKKETAK